MRTKMRVVGFLAVVLIFGVGLLSGAPDKIKFHKSDSAEVAKSAKIQPLFVWGVADKALYAKNSVDLDLLYKKIATQVKEISWKKGDTYLQEPRIEGNARLRL